MTVYEILGKVMEIVKERGTERDLPNGERSMTRCVNAFNSLCGKDLSVQDGWRFMLMLKLSRQQEGSFKADDFFDCVGYSALLAEEAFKNVES